MVECNFKPQPFIPNASSAIASMVTKPLSNCFQLYLANLLLVSKLCRMLKNKNQRH